MFGWFGNRCPLSTFEKTWIEWRLSWLVEQFGFETMLKAPLLLPNDEGLVGQAAAAFELWFGILPDQVSALKACREAVAARA